MRQTDNLTQYVVVMPDGQEIYSENRERDGAQHACEQAIRSTKFTTSWLNPKTVQLLCYRIVIKDGKLERRLVITSPVMPFRADPTPEEFIAESDRLLGDLPPPLASWISEYAYERGHSDGRQEVLAYIANLSHDLRPIVSEIIRNATNQAV